MSIVDGLGSPPDGVCDWYPSEDPNVSVAAGGKPRRQPRINKAKNASDKILVSEVRNKGFVLTPWNPNNVNPDPTIWHEWEWRRHKGKDSDKFGKANVLWLDGHVTTAWQGVDLPNRINDICYYAYWLPTAEAAKRGANSSGTRKIEPNRPERSYRSSASIAVAANRVPLPLPLP